MEDIKTQIKYLTDCLTEGKYYGNLAIIIIHAIIIITLILCLWKRNSFTLALILSVILIFLSFVQKKYSPLFFIGIGIFLSLIELGFVKLGVYDYKSTNYIPLWKIPMWGIHVYYVLSIANLFVRY